MNFKGFLCCFFVIVIISSVYTQTELYEGDNCTTIDNEPGIFKNLNNCVEYFITMRDKHGCYLRSQLVGCKQLPDGGYEFCCRTDSESTTSQPPPTQPPLAQQPPILKMHSSSEIHSRSEKACQKYQHLRENFPVTYKRCHRNQMMGDRDDSEINEFPHMVAIGYGKENDPLTYDFDCAGSLISEKYVLTVDHCMNRRNRVPRIVRLGKVSLDDTNTKDCYYAINVNIITITLHKEYDPQSKSHDIALLELEESVNQYFGRSLFPACLHNGFEINSDLTVTGWRLMMNNQIRSDWLKKSENLKEITLDDCKQRYEVLPKTIFDTQICTTSPVNADACQGDSGGPLSFKIGEIHYIAGVVSSGAFCGRKYPGVHTRVSSYIEWIEDIVWPQIPEKPQWI